MTFLTILSKFILMHIFMTRSTVLELQVGKVLEFLAVYCYKLMTINAFHSFVLPEQREVCFAVVKTGCIFKRIKTMAAVTFWRKVFLMEMCFLNWFI